MQTYFPEAEHKVYFVLVGVLLVAKSSTDIRIDREVN